MSAQLHKSPAVILDVAGELLAAAPQVGDPTPCDLGLGVLPRSVGLPLDPSVPAERSPTRMFLAGMAVTLGNPKIMIFYLALVPTIIDLSHVSAIAWAELMATTVIVLMAVDLMSADAVSDGRLKRLFEPVVEERLGYYLVTVEGRREPRKLKLFREWLRHVRRRRLCRVRW